MPGQDLYAVAGELQRAALAAVEPAAAVYRHVRRQGDVLIVADRRYDLRDYGRIFVVGGGKAAVPMAAAVAHILGDRLTASAIVTKYGHVRSLQPPTSDFQLPTSKSSKPAIPCPMRTLSAERRPWPTWPAR